MKKLLLLFVFVAIFVSVEQAHSVGLDADRMCNPVIPACPCGTIPGPMGCIGGPNMFMCPCFDITNGQKTTGVCVAPMKCLGKTSGGKPLMPPKPPMKMPSMPMMPMPMMPMPTQPTTTSPLDLGTAGDIFSGLNGTSTGSNIGDVLDSIFGESGTSSATTTVTNVSGGGGVGSVDDFGPVTTQCKVWHEGSCRFCERETAGGVPTCEIQSSDVCPASVGCIENFTETTVEPYGGINDGTANNISNLQGTGVVDTLDNTTLVVSAEDESSNTGFGGFFGGSTSESATGATSLVGRLCETRPWASGLVARIIPPSFFDGLCARRGLSVGSSAEDNLPADTSDIEARILAGGEEDGTSTVTGGGLNGRGIVCEPNVVGPGGSARLEFSCGSVDLVGTAGFEVENAGQTTAQVTPFESTRYGILCSDDFVAECTVGVADPRVTIWADPEEIALGTRTTIFWNTEDVKTGSCKVTGPSFSETGEFGGAGTAVINDISTFTITCEGLDGTEVSGDVQVGLTL